jgi:hypothetical protein
MSSRRKAQQKATVVQKNENEGVGRKIDSKMREETRPVAVKLLMLMLLTM